MVRPPEVMTPLQGLQQHFPDRELVYVDGADLIAAADAARNADLALVVVGYTHADEGEYVSGIPLVAKEKGGDRFSLTLSPHDEELILQTAAANPRTVVVMEGGSAIITEAWRNHVPAMLMLWYPGMEGGHALANLLSGRVNPSGKLPCVFPKSTDQLPFFDPNADEIEYGLYHGYRLMDQQGQEPAFAFGFGLSYTTFEVDRLQVEADAIKVDEKLKVSVRVKNTSPHAGAEVIQLYVGCEKSTYDRPVKELKGFRKIVLQPGEEQTVSFEVSVCTLSVWDGGWKVEPGSYKVWIGTSSRAEDLLETRIQIG